jgi:hypothetical protein
MRGRNGLESLINDKDKWYDTVNPVINLQVPQNQ